MTALRGWTVHLRPPRSAGGPPQATAITLSSRTTRPFQGHPLDSSIRSTVTTLCGSSCRGNRFCRAISYWTPTTLSYVRKIVNMDGPPPLTQWLAREPGPPGWAGSALRDRSEVPFRERPPRSCLRIGFETRRDLRVGELEGHHERPRAAVDGHAARPVLCQCSRPSTSLVIPM